MHTEVRHRSAKAAPSCSSFVSEANVASFTRTTGKSVRNSQIDVKMKQEQERSFPLSSEPGASPVKPALGGTGALPAAGTALNTAAGAPAATGHRGKKVSALIKGNGGGGGGGGNDGASAHDGGNRDLNACGCGAVSSAGTCKSKACRASAGRRDLYRLVARVADFSERASFHPGFLNWTYISRLLAVAFYFLVAVYLNALATMIATHRNPYAMMLDRYGEPLRVHTLPDLGHDLWAFFLNRLGHHTDYIDQHALPDRMVKLSGKVVFLFIASHPQRLKISRRVFTIFATVLLMRAVSVSVTVLPDASPVCRARLEEGPAISELFPRAFIEAAQFVWAPTSFITCGDMVFSGHTTCLMMVAMTFREYCRAEHLQTKVLFTKFHLSERLLSLVRRAVYAYAALGCLVIIGSKLHYTLDVLLAILLGSWSFCTFHNWARHDPLRRKSRVLEWLESEDVRDQDDLAYTMARRP